MIFVIKNFQKKTKKKEKIIHYTKFQLKNSKKKNNRPGTRIFLLFGVFEAIDISQ